MASKHVPVPHPSASRPASPEAARDGRRLRAIRELREQTQQDFADDLGIRADTVSTYELGRHRCPRAVMRLAERLLGPGRLAALNAQVGTPPPDEARRPRLADKVLTCLTLTPEAVAHVAGMLGLDPERASGVRRATGRVQLTVLLDRDAYTVLQRAAPGPKRYGQFVSEIICAQNGQADERPALEGEPGRTPKEGYGRVISRVLREYAAQQQHDTMAP